VVLTLSRRNLTSLLAKLDGHPPGSTKTLERAGSDGQPYFVVRAESDEVHYAKRAPGPMHRDTEVQLGEYATLRNEGKPGLFS
jgi:hypothetical protein